MKRKKGLFRTLPEDEKKDKCAVSALPSAAAGMPLFSLDGGRSLL
jgi:hypothetical protein